MKKAPREVEPEEEEKRRILEVQVVLNAQALDMSELTVGTQEGQGKGLQCDS